MVLQSKTNGWELNHPPPLFGIVSFRGCTLPETTIDLKNCRLEDEILFGMAYFSESLAVSFRDCREIMGVSVGWKLSCGTAADRLGRSMFLLGRKELSRVSMEGNDR